MKKIKRNKVFYILILLPFAFVSIIPLYWMFISAFKDAASIIKMPPDWIVLNPTLKNFISLFQSSKILRWFINSVIVACFVTVGNIVFDTMAGYAFAKRKFFGNKLFFWLIMGGLMIPSQITLIPLFLLMVNLGFYNNYAGLIIPTIATPFGIFLMKQFIETIPMDLESAARIDGASEMQIFWKIIFPLSRPAWTVTGLFHFVANWNSFLWPLIMVDSDAMRTLPIGLSTLKSQYSVDFGIMMAGAVFAALPMFIVFFVFQRYFFAGLTVGSMKE